jgi:hypothetical protein
MKPIDNTPEDEINCESKRIDVPIASDGNIVSVPFRPDFAVSIGSLCMVR